MQGKLNASSFLLVLDVNPPPSLIGYPDRVEKRKKRHGENHQEEAKAQVKGLRPHSF